MYMYVQYMYMYSTCTCTVHAWTYQWDIINVVHISIKIRHELINQLIKGQVNNRMQSEVTI